MKTALLPLLLILLTTLIIACSNKADPQASANQNTQTSVNEEATRPPSSNAATTNTVVEDPASTPRPRVAMPTKPQPIAGLLTPTIPPTPTPKTTNPSTGQSPPQTPDPTNAATAQNNPTTPSTSPKMDVPQDAQFNDKVLLQDIYAAMDLSQFALNPNEPVPLPIEADRYDQTSKELTHMDLQSLKRDDDRVTENYVDIPSVFIHDEIKDHPYLHLFPGLQSQVNFFTQEEPYANIIRYHPYFNQERFSGGRDYKDQLASSFQLRNGIEHFLFNPWYEPIHPTSLRGSHASTGLPYRTWGPHWFGKNSTRGVLAKGVTETLRNAVHPEVEYKPIPLSSSDETGPNWTLLNYITTPVLDFQRAPFNLGARNRPHSAFRTPTTKWEFVHPQLPIVKVTSYNTLVLPFLDRDERPSLDRPSRLMKFYKDTRQNSSEHVQERFCRDIDFTKVPKDLARKYGPCGGTSTSRFKHIESTPPEDLVHLLSAAPAEYFDMFFPSKELNPNSETTFAVSFVIAFQNRWDSFTNPDRWLIRFHDDLMPRTLTTNQHQTLEPWQGAIDPDFNDQHFPNYWHTSDYMQHSIIGPVVLHVYESEVLQPSTYSFTPTVTEWEAPGYIVPDDRQLIVKTTIYRDLEPGQPHIFEGFTDKVNSRPALGTLGSKKDGKTLSSGSLRLEAVPFSPNPGFPLPDHVMTAADSAPGTEIWELFNMDDNDW